MENKKKQIILNCEKLEARCAILNSTKLEEYEIERSYEGPKVGSIYLGKIVNLEPSLHAAFVNIGATKNAFLHYWDMIPASYEIQEKIAKEDNSTESKKNKPLTNTALETGEKAQKIRQKEAKLRNKKITTKDIPALFPPGTELLVQVVKEPIGTKGARLTTNISIPGRYLVLLPYSDHIGLSTKIEQAQERTRLKKILANLEVPDGMGMICRTVGEGRKAVFFKRDLDILVDSWHQVETALETHKVPSLVYEEPNLIERTVRDSMTEDIDEIIVDSTKAFDKIYKMLRKFGGLRMASKVVQYNRAQPIFEHFKIKEQLTAVFGRTVALPSGGYICVDETEALIAVDVNTGKGKRCGEQPEVILQTNLEAAEEVARQLRLRNVGGLVVIDFIDMRSSRDRDKVYKHMRKLVKDDRAKSKILPLSRLGLMEMTRQREHESLQATVFDTCPYCKGSGHIKSPLTMSVEIQRRLRSLLKARGQKKIAIRVFMHPEILARLKNEDAELLQEMEHSFGRDLSFRADSTLHHEEIRFVDPVTGVEMT